MADPQENLHFDDEEDEEVEDVAAVDAPVHFSLSPALASTTVIDYNTNAGAKLFAAATCKLTTDFDLSSNGLKLFLTQLADRARFSGWTDILMISQVIGAEHEVLINLVTHHGMLSLEQVRAHVATYDATPTRAAQDTTQLYVCIMNSLTPEAQNKITIREEEYILGEELNTVLGTCLLKVIVMEASIDTNATARRIREKLSDLSSYMVSVDSDVMLYNFHVNQLVINLAARGETTQDLLSNLLKGYKAAADETFVKYIETKQDDYDEGLPITAERLMSLAELKYKIMTAEGKWKSPSEDSSKIIVLEAQVKAIGNKYNSAAQPKGDPKRPPNNKGRLPQKKKDRNANPEWMQVPPPQGSLSLRPSTARMVSGFGAPPTSPGENTTRKPAGRYRNRTSFPASHLLLSPGTRSSG
jgi:hypothetical protein